MFNGELPLSDVPDLHLKIISASASVLLLALVLLWQGKERKPMGQGEKLDTGAVTANSS